MPHPRAPLPRRGRRRIALAATLAVFGSLALAGCTQAVAFDAGESASDPDCAAVSVRLPDAVAGLAERETNAQGTGAWGNPAAVLLRCGVEPLGPTTDRCVSVDGVDWVIDESDAPNYRFTTYGRTPAVEVLVDNDTVSGTTAISDLSGAVSVIPPEDGCVSVDDATPPAN